MSRFLPWRRWLAHLLSVVVCQSVRLSQVDILLKRLTLDHANNTCTRQPKDASFLMPNISAKLERVQPQWRRQMQVGRGRLNVGAIAEYWRLSMRSVVSLVRSQVYDTQRPPHLFADVRRNAARRAGLSTAMVLVIRGRITLRATAGI